MSGTRYNPMTESSCYILLSIAKGAKHGYAIMQHIKEMTNANITLGNGTLYGALTRMVEDKVINIYYEEEKKVYEITPFGQELLLQEQKRLTNLLANFAGIEPKLRSTDLGSEF